MKMLPLCIGDAGGNFKPNLPSFCPGGVFIGSCLIIIKEELQTKVSWTAILIHREDSTGDCSSMPKGRGASEGTGGEG